MNILEITFIPPSKDSGGGLGVYQSIRSLAYNGNVDYIGPEYNQNIFCECPNTVNNIAILNAKRSGIFKIMYRLFVNKVSTSFYDQWLVAKRGIEWEKYDFIHIEFSRYEFLVEECHRHNKKCMIRIHNIEKDYLYSLFRLSQKFLDFLRYKSFEINEKAVFSKADFFIFITNNDIKRANELYGIKNSKIGLNPVCLDQADVIQSMKTHCKTVLMTGSLSYGPNAEGIIWFIEHVWGEIEPLETDVNLLIAGSYPGTELIEAVSHYRKIKLIDTPEVMSPYFNSSDLYVASVFAGAGMKVKVAEALSYGLPVIGTKHAFIGYENISYGKFEANTKEEFVNVIRNLCHTGNGIREKIIKEFQLHFSMKSSCERYKKYISEVVK